MFASQHQPNSSAKGSCTCTHVSARLPTEYACLVCQNESQTNKLKELAYTKYSSHTLAWTLFFLSTSSLGNIQLLVPMRNQLQHKMKCHDAKSDTKRNMFTTTLKTI